MKLKLVLRFVGLLLVSIFGFFVVVMSFSSVASASTSQAAGDGDQTHPLMTPEEQEIHLRAKKRLYPGGRDEEPLQVQMQLQQANRKMAPATEAPAEEGPSDAAAD